MVIDATARDRARARVGDEIVRQSISPTDLARRAGVDVDTVGDFLNGNRWPQPAKRNAISTALGWAPEGIDEIVRGGEPTLAEPETVSNAPQDDGILGSLPPGSLDGLDDTEVAEVIAAAKLRALERVREIRRQKDS